MNYTSTRDKSVSVSASQAISQGISKDGGLFVPTEFPKISLDEIKGLSKLDYIGRAKAVLSLFLNDFTKDEIDYCVENAYGHNKFDSEKVAPLANYNDDASILELWRGPTCAFKDMALQLLPYLLTVSAKKTAQGKTIIILVATSGDTGKAALEGFKNVENTKILVFYPSEGVSPMQKLQMTTQDGDNVSVCAIEGNFDDAQTGVKKIFTDNQIAEKLAEKNMQFSSANSINWGRLAPQIVYYFSAYCDMMNNGKISLGDKINIVVPTGNFGNILAAYYAKKMGLPVHKFICASNANNVLTEFLKSGKYDRNRNFYTTTSPSMDILVSSNLERLLFDLCDNDDEQIKKWMSDLSVNGTYTITDEVMKKISDEFDAGFCDDEQTKKTISSTFKDKNYLSDTHTAVALCVYKNYVKETGDNSKTIIASTANPYKFSKDVLSAISENDETKDEFEIIKKLSQTSAWECPKQLASLKGKKPRFTKTCKKSEMKEVLFELLNI